MTKGCESELTPPDESSHRSNRTYSKTATTQARFLGRRPGFSCGSHTPNRIEAPSMVRRLPLDVGLRCEPLVQTSPDVSRCLCGLTCTRPCSNFVLPRKPKSRTLRTTRYPACGPICESHALPAGRSKQVDQRGRGPGAPWATAEHKARSTAIIGVCLWAIVCPQREQCHCTCNLSGSRSRSCAVAAIIWGRVSFRASREPGALVGDGLYGRGVKLLLYADCQRSASLTASTRPPGPHGEGPLSQKSVSKFIAHNASPGVSCQIKRRIRSQHMRPDLVDNDLAPAIECRPDSTPQAAILEAALASRVRSSS